MFYVCVLCAAVVAVHACVCVSIMYKEAWVVQRLCAASSVGLDPPGPQEICGEPSEPSRPVIS